MHDLFRVPLGEVAEVLNTSPANAKKLASRARRRLQGLEVLPEAGSRPNSSHMRIVDAFLAAARGGELDRLLALMAPDVEQDHPHLDHSAHADRHGVAARLAGLTEAECPGHATDPAPRSAAGGSRFDHCPWAGDCTEQ
jgi:hypothetical protein